MRLADDTTIYAVKAIPPSEDDNQYWIPQIYGEIQRGNARFGWSYFDGADLKLLKNKLGTAEWEQFSEDEKNVWSHAAFLLDVKPEDYFVYINMPKYGECTIAKIKDSYKFDEVWDVDRYGDFRHVLPCENIDTFDRSAYIVHPYLQRRLRLMGAWWRIYAKEEFEELLINLQQGRQGLAPKARLREKIDAQLDQIAVQIYRHFPETNLEAFLMDVFATMPQVKEVRKGPDKNGADLEIEFESGLDILGLKTQHLCAVQVKSYKGSLGYTRAIEDIRRAFQSNDKYMCGLIVSTALEMTESFEGELEKLREETGKDVGVLLGKELSYTLMKSGFRETNDS